MTLLTAKQIKPLNSYAVDNLFSLTIKHTKFHTNIHMNFFTALVNTRDLPWTYSLLSEYLPSILQSTCYNDENIPFAIEVKRTELGHLFEHIVLEYLCEEKLRLGFEEATFSGRTKWNWEQDPYGVFHIHIDMPISDRDIFSPALHKSIFLMRRIITRNSCPLRLSEPYLLSLTTNTVS